MNKKFFKVKCTIGVFAYLFLMFIMLINNVNADSKNKNLFSVDYSTEVELYNYDNEICAYYYKINQSGYVIIDSITNDIIEFSYNDDNTNITADEGKQYYFGIFEYYEKRANKYKNTRTKIVINKSKAEELNDGYEDIRKEASSGTFVDGTYTYAKFVQVNDGWGNKGVWLNYKYVDGVVYLK